MTELIRRRRALMGKVTASEDVLVAFPNANTVINIATGAAEINSSWATSDRVVVPGGKTLSYTNNLSERVYFRGAVYTAEDGFVDSDLNKVLSVNVGATLTLTIPADAAYMRLSVQKNNQAASETLRFEVS